jgi:hypothetical protein
VCADPFAIGILDDQPGDQAAAATLIAALQGGCTAPTLDGGLVWDVDGGAIDYATGAPIIRGGKMLVAVGGWWMGSQLHGQRLVHFLETQGYTAVYDASNSTNAIFGLRDGGTVASVPSAALTSADDYFLIEAVRDPVRGSFAFIVYGFGYAGTVAGSWYVQNTLMPSLSSHTEAWDVFHWQEADGGTGPSVNDTWTLLNQGP